jgi:hypothetical protein
MTKHPAAEPRSSRRTGEPSVGTTGPPTSRPEPDAGPRALLPGTRAILAAFVVLTAVATYDLFLQPARTQAGFAWTIHPPLTAAFLGAGYGAGCVLTILGLRARTWADARLTATTVLVFVVLTLTATLLHLGQFHFRASGIIPQFAAWFWLAVYLTVPLGLTAATTAQTRRRGADLPRDQPLPIWLAIVLAAQGAVMLTGGIALFADWHSAATLWPWTLTPLTAGAIAGWLISFGVAAILALLERDLRRLHAATAGYTVFGLLELLAVARFAGQIHWASPAAIIYLTVASSVVAAGSAGWLLGNRPALMRRNVSESEKPACRDGQA